MQRRQLPIGIQTFRTIREEDCYYVDKTPLIHELVNGGRHYFLSRPRRFGKSLLIDTLRELFSGNEPLFRGLAIHDRWNWNETHPVVRLSFDGKNNEPGDLEENIRTQLLIAERSAGLDPAPDSMDGPNRLRYLLHRLYDKTGRQVAVLVDEYDKPILDVLNDPEMANANREYLRGFYGVIKGAAEHVRFVFVTGISMFTKVSLFSGLNNLENISLDPTFAAICGYTDRDLDTVFAPELEGLDHDEVRRWYNGYHWLGEEKLYNPFDILLLFRSRRFKAHWYETGTPDMLYRKIVEEKRNPMELERLLADEGLMSSFDVSDIDLRALMFQAGYLTIAREEDLGADRTVRAGVPESGSAVQFQQGSARPRGPGPGGSDPVGQRVARSARGGGFRGLRRTAQDVPCRGSAPVVRRRRRRPLRGALRGHAVSLFPRRRGGSCGGGRLQPRPGRHGRVPRRQGIRA